MKTSFLIFLCMFALNLTSSLATDNYAYGSDEYVTITDGMSPDGKYAITAHGGGEYGYENFHLFLTNAETGKKIGPLEEVVETLDTGAASFCALWSKDSQNVSLFYRISRQEPIREMSYRINSGRAFPVKGPVAVATDYAWYWSQHCSYNHQTGKTYGTPLQHQPQLTR